MSDGESSPSFKKQNLFIPSKLSNLKMSDFSNDLYENYDMCKLLC